QPRHCRTRRRRPRCRIARGSRRSPQARVAPRAATPASRRLEFPCRNRAWRRAESAVQPPSRQEAARTGAAADPTSYLLSARVHPKGRFDGTNRATEQCDAPFRGFMRYPCGKLCERTVKTLWIRADVCARLSQGRVVDLSQRHPPSARAIGAGPARIPFVRSSVMKMWKRAVAVATLLSLTSSLAPIPASAESTQQEIQIGQQAAREVD